MGMAVSHWKFGHKGPRGFGPPPLHEGSRDNKAHEERMVRILTKRFSLDDKQQAKVESIIAEGGMRLKALHAETVPKFEEIRTDIEAKLRAVMVGDQIEKFDKIHRDKLKRPRPPRRPR
jgi:hypothetical protein